MNEEQKLELVGKLKSALSEWKGSDISIRKHEQRDLDEVTMNLLDVEWVDRPATLDDYLGEYLLKLRGHGSITAEKDVQDLPQNDYEIPLAGLHNVDVSESRVHLESSRASYTVTKA